MTTLQTRDEAYLAHSRGQISYETLTIILRDLAETEALKEEAERAAA